MQCTNQSRHDGHFWKTNVWNADKGKYEEQSVWCPGKVT